MSYTAPSPTLRAELGATLRLALPLAGANLIQMAIHAVDVIFIARLGETELAAATLGVSAFGLLVWSSTGLIALAPIAAAELGRRRHAVREVRRTTRMALWLSAMVALVLTALLQFGESLMLATGQSPKLAAHSGEFLGILSFAILPMLVSITLRQFISTLDRASYATWINILALAVNTLGNWLLVYGNWGFPALGIVGSATSSIVTSWAMVLAYVIVIRLDRRLRRYRIFGNWWRSEWPRFFEMIRIGGPIAATILAEAGLFAGAAFLMGRIGEAELAGHAVALQVAALAFQVPFGVAQAATIRVGLSYGAGNPAGIARAGTASLLFGIGFMAMTAGAMLAMPRTILSIYVDVDAPANAAMMGHAVQYLFVAALFQLFDGAQAVGAGALRGLQDTRIPMVYALFGYWIPGLGTSVWLGFFTPLGGLGVWIGLLVGLVVVAALMLWRWSNRERLGLHLASAALEKNLPQTA
ncbi:MAG TPA: MATE family efflux transporter [Sphingomonadaceae bacterium]|nr:MATE family efflux transporter [Sphingomonadaceae bacterium]